MAVDRVDAFDLLERMHRERAGAHEPSLVAGSFEELQEGVAVARRAVAEARTLLQRACDPRELAAGDEQVGERIVGRCERTRAR